MLPTRAVRYSGWLGLAALPTAVLALAPDGWPAWALMWALAVALYAGCKWLSWAGAVRSRATVGRRLGYLLAWPGLDAAAFLDGAPLPDAQRPTQREWALATGRMILGAALFWGAARWLPRDAELAIGWVGMIGLIMMLHFGGLHLLSCAWRCAGVRARPLMAQPLRSRSLGEFWGRRWNTAFRDLTHRFLFRPLTQRLGAAGAVITGFLFSGLAHDVVISLPARGGYGGPTLFFVLQGAALVFERSPAGRRLGLGTGWRGRAFMLLTLAAPTALLLFHPPFVRRVIVPFMAATGAL